jgi:hypothetical protein
MSSQAEYNFADWYRPVDNQLTAEIQSYRISAIKVLLSNQDKSFWLDVVRLFWSIPTKSLTNKDTFIRAFKDADPVFPVSGNDHLVKVLAGILLCFRLERISHLNILVALAIKNINFLGQYQDNTIVPVVNNVSTFLVAESKQQRDIFTSAFDDELNELDERKEEDGYVFVDVDHAVVVNAAHAMMHAQKVFSEETNILWWLFGEASITYEESLKSIGLPKTILVIAKELFELFEFTLGTAKISSIINKAISNSVVGKANKDYSPLELIGKFNSSEIQILLGDYKAETEFTPILSALYKFPTLTKTENLASLYAEEFHNGDLKKPFSPQLISIQILHEFLLLKKLK